MNDKIRLCLEITIKLHIQELKEDGLPLPEPNSLVKYAT